jgi:hypothetical protein
LEVSNLGVDEAGGMISAAGAEDPSSFFRFFFSDPPIFS